MVGDEVMALEIFVKAMSMMKAEKSLLQTGEREIERD
jgi:hypothetical protein